MDPQTFLDMFAAYRTTRGSNSTTAGLVAPVAGLAASAAPGLGSQPAQTGFAAPLNGSGGGNAGEGVDAGTSDHGLLDGLATFGVNALGFMSPLGIVGAMAALANPNQAKIDKASLVDTAIADARAGSLNEGLGTPEGRQATFDGAFANEQEGRNAQPNDSMQGFAAPAAPSPTVDGLAAPTVDTAPASPTKDGQDADTDADPDAGTDAGAQGPDGNGSTGSDGGGGASGPSGPSGSDPGGASGSDPY